MLWSQVCAELEEEKRKHAQDTAQGDDVTYMLEKDRERLKNEVRISQVVNVCVFINSSIAIRFDID